MENEPDPALDHMEAFMPEVLVADPEKVNVSRYLDSDLFQDDDEEVAPSHEKLLAHFSESDTIEEQENGDFTTWDPADKDTGGPPCAYRLGTQRKRRSFTESMYAGWGDSLRELSNTDGSQSDRNWFIVGAGANGLEQNLSLYPHEVFYGINWTRQWFEPTFLQIVDNEPLEQEIWDENFKHSVFPPKTQLVTSSFLANSSLQHSIACQNALIFNINHDRTPDRERAHEMLWANHPSEPMTWSENSLAYALNVAAWYRPKKIILIGMDFGGAHIFGDGRSKGCSCNYKMGTSNIVNKLAFAKGHLDELEVPVVHAGDSNLDLFPKYQNIEEALRA